MFDIEFELFHYIYIYIPPISSKFFRFFLELWISLFRGKEEIRPSFFKRREGFMTFYLNKERERENCKEIPWYFLFIKI